MVVLALTLNCWKVSHNTTSDGRTLVVTARVYDRHPGLWCFLMPNCCRILPYSLYAFCGAVCGRCRIFSTQKHGDSFVALSRLKVFHTSVTAQYLECRRALHTKPCPLLASSRRLEYEIISPVLCFLLNMGTRFTLQSLVLCLEPIAACLALGPSLSWKKQETYLVRPSQYLR